MFKFDIVIVRYFESIKENGEVSEIKDLGKDDEEKEEFFRLKFIKKSFIVFSGFNVRNFR